MIVKSPFLKSLRDVIRVKRYSLQTEKSYLYWVKFFIMFNDKRHPRDMGAPEINRFLTHLAVNRRVSAATQNQALCALVFMYKHIFEKQFDGLIFSYAKRPKNIPSVPASLHRKYKAAMKDFAWQYLFPSSTRCKHPIDEYICRHHLHPSTLTKHLRQAVLKAKVNKKVSAHTFRHSFATALYN